MIMMQFTSPRRIYSSPLSFSTKKKLFTNENAQQENFLPLDETRNLEKEEKNCGLSGK